MLRAFFVSHLWLPHDYRILHEAGLTHGIPPFSTSRYLTVGISRISRKTGNQQKKSKRSVDADSHAHG